MHTPSATAPLSRSECLKALDLPESASPTDIQQAFRMLVLKLHPDRNAGSPDSNQAFVRVVEAYKTLRGLGVSEAARPQAIPPQEIKYKRVRAVSQHRDGLWSLTKAAAFAGIFWAVLFFCALWDAGHAEWRLHHLEPSTADHLAVPLDAKMWIALEAIGNSSIIGMAAGLVTYLLGRLCDYCARRYNGRSTRGIHHHPAHGR